ncbi:3-oxosteroid 1-dehydrogenase [Entomortierella parvispora]|uniref:3-oxosteroid 1-dehydrogenase n=1 Tax=Entomortierella parvispora TaxID=205924 RepID=A0A9P3LYU4_9FUNG|nr:3-oxosteroid 1-dehydrogenase [Entomortierella parvispora]
MTAALAAKKRGLNVVVIEKSRYFGGSTARSGGAIWVPNNSVILGAGVPDSAEQAATYLSNVVGPEIPKDRQQAFLEHGPKMIDFIMDNTPLRFQFLENYSDYYPHFPGGLDIGRSIEAIQVDANLLGAEKERLNPPYMPMPPGIVMYSADYKWVNLAGVNVKGLATGIKCMLAGLRAMALRQNPQTMGAGLAVGLRLGLMDAKIPVWHNTPLLDLVQDGDAISGVVVEMHGVRTTIRAKKGVVIGSGGFEQNAEMRNKYQQQPINTKWTVGSKDNTGDGIWASEKVGAALDLMDDSWWGPTVPVPGQPYFCLSERALPGGLFVNKHGKRFVNEAGPYCEVVHVMYEQDKSDDGSEIPTWMIVDQRFRNRYLFKDVPGRFPIPKFWYESGVVKKAKTLHELAKDINVPADALQATVTRFNGQAKKGVDEDFGRGNNMYDRFYTDPAVKPNPCLAPLEQGPFYAFKIAPGDLGTKGGIVTDARARALRSDGTVIKGLWAAGNASAAVMGNSYAGAGSTIGPAMTFGYIAANDLADL